jgi:hypothetical protein
MTSALDMGGWSTPRPGRFTPGKDPVPIVQEAEWAPGPVRTGAENLASTGIRSPDRPARSESLYRLSYLLMHILQFLDNRQGSVAGLSALHTGRLYPLGDTSITGTHFCQRLSRTQGHNAAGRIKSMKNPIDPVIFWLLV